MKIKDLEIGKEMIVKSHDEWPSAQMYAHVVSRRKGWKITACWDKEKNVGIVRRLR